MELKPLFIAALVALSLGLAACGDSGSDSTSSEADTVPPASEEATESSGAEAGGETESGSEPAPSGEAKKSEKVDIVEFTYQPDPVVVQVDGKVVWQNQDSAPHTATADDGSFDTGTIEKGKLGSANFKEPGTYAYFCEIHPDMRGSVEVVE